MASSVKSFFSMLLLVGMLSFLTVSASEEDAPPPSPTPTETPPACPTPTDQTVVFLYQEALPWSSHLELTGNTPPLDNNHFDNAPEMTHTPNDVWFLTVNLTANTYYTLRLGLSMKPCIPRDGIVFHVGEAVGKLLPVVLTGFNCSEIMSNAMMSNAMM